MLGMNLHAIVRGSITSVHPDETVALYQSDGQAVAYGRVTPYYKEPITIAAQIQPNAENSLDHSENVPDMPHTEQMFVDSSQPLPVDGISRVPLCRTGDIIQREDGTYWHISKVLEDWSAHAGWANFEITQLVTPPVLQTRPAPEPEPDPEEPDEGEGN